MPKKIVRSVISLSKHTYKRLEECKYAQFCKSFDEIIKKFMDKEERAPIVAEEIHNLNRKYEGIISHLLNNVPLTDEQQRLVGYLIKEKEEGPKQIDSR